MAMNSTAGKSVIRSRKRIASVLIKMYLLKTVLELRCEGKLHSNDGGNYSVRGEVDERSVFVASS
jgi:hypothetical protein